MLVFKGGGCSPLLPPSTTVKNEQSCLFSSLHIFFTYIIVFSLICNIFIIFTLFLPWARVKGQQKWSGPGLAQPMDSVGIVVQDVNRHMEQEEAEKRKQHNAAHLTG